jgi:hypothetical protein
MNDQVHKLLAEVPRPAIEDVARGVLDDPSVSLIGEPGWHAVGGLHGDRRTIGLRRLEGQASSGSDIRSWSAVLKIIDVSVEINPFAEGYDPEVEINLYENGIFPDPDAPFHPARCYRIDRLDESLTLLWLEDLSGAPQPPWSVQHYAETSFNLGRFHGKNLRESLGS